MNTLLAEPKPATRPAGVWDYISPSRLNLWLKCPLAFKLRYIDGVRSPTTPNLFLGKRVHQGLEIFYRHRQLGIQLEPYFHRSRWLVWRNSSSQTGIELLTANNRLIAVCVDSEKLFDGCVDKPKKDIIQPARVFLPP